MKHDYTAIFSWFMTAWLLQVFSHFNKTLLWKHFIHSVLHFNFHMYFRSALLFWSWACCDANASSTTVFMRKYSHKKWPIIFSGKFGKIWAKSFAPQKIACSYAYESNAKWNQFYQPKLEPPHMEIAIAYIAVFHCQLLYFAHFKLFGKSLKKIKSLKNARKGSKFPT